MGRNGTGSFRTEEQKKFFNEITAAGAGAISPLETFEDACRVFALTLHNPILKQMGQNEQYEKYEREHIRIMKRYGKEGGQHIVNAFKILIDALTKDRKDFLGQMMEIIGATDKYKSQFFTPIHVSEFMAKIACFDSLDENGEGGGALMEKVKRGELVTLNDSCCGASVLLIAGAEELMRYVPQSQIMLYAEDLGTLTFNVSYTQLSLLGYAAQVTQMNSLSMEVYEGPWHTFGYFAHGVPQRMRSLGLLSALKGLIETCDKAEKPAVVLPHAMENTTKLPAESIAKPFVAVGGTQLELDFGE